MIHNVNTYAKNSEKYHPTELNNMTIWEESRTQKIQSRLNIMLHDLYCRTVDCITKIMLHVHFAVLF